MLNTITWMGSPDDSVELALLELELSEPELLELELLPHAAKPSAKAKATTTATVRRRLSLLSIIPFLHV